MYQYRRERLLTLIGEKYAGTRKNIADASGWSEARMSQILSPNYREGRAFSEKIARKLEFDLNLESMYFDRGAIDRSAIDRSANEAGVLSAAAERASRIMAGARAVVVAESGDERFCEIRKVKLCLSAGITGFKLEPEQHDGSIISVPRSWVERNGFYPEKLVAIKVKGESMEPALYEGDLVIINTADTRPADGVVFAVNYEGEPVVKRMSRDIGEWWLSSDNPDQRKYHRKMCRGNDCLIIGRVVRKESDRI
ncbi:SOS-response transcriptional repressor LexA [Oxalobacteraceae bacterium GrIS 1.11]